MKRVQALGGIFSPIVYYKNYRSPLFFACYLRCSAKIKEGLICGVIGKGVVCRDDEAPSGGDELGGKLWVSFFPLRENLLAALSAT
ncbi:hypothetical protein [Acidovorax sp. NB1]|uniref:hypothetical protein n=1 Tax=Acidovorax sp. NB1 TaxID=1943571 RepID=UPI0010F9D0A7|nr:hypothetical protein [Acidovorax sp. NB1]